MQDKQLEGIVYSNLKPSPYWDLPWPQTTTNDTHILCQCTHAAQDKWLKSIVETCRSDRFITTIGGRRRYLTDIMSSDPRQRAAAERQAVNSAAQV